MENSIQNQLPNVNKKKNKIFAAVVIGASVIFSSVVYPFLADGDFSRIKDAYGVEYGCGGYSWYVLSISEATAPSIVIDSSIDGLPVENVLGGGDNGYIKEIILPDSVKEISHGAFSGCTSLEAIKIPDSVEFIGYEAFSGCTSLEAITIPDGVKSIGECTFYGCTSLEAITIPDGVEFIGNRAFLGCTSLETITIPKSVSHIPYDLFYNCDSLQTVFLPFGTTIEATEFRVDWHAKVIRY